MKTKELVTLIINNTRAQYDATVRVKQVYTKDELITMVKQHIKQKSK